MIYEIIIPWFRNSWHFFQKRCLVCHQFIVLFLSRFSFTIRSICFVRLGMTLHAKRRQEAGGRETGTRGQGMRDRGQGTGDMRWPFTGFAAYSPATYSLKRSHATGTAHFVKISRATPAFFPTERKMALQAASNPCEGTEHGGGGRIRKVQATVVWSILNTYFCVVL